MRADADNRVLNMGYESSFQDGFSKIFHEPSTHSLKMFVRSFEELLSECVLMQKVVYPLSEVRVKFYNFSLIQSARLTKKNQNKSRIRCNTNKLDIQLIGLFDNLYRSFSCATEQIGCGVFGCGDLFHEIKVSVYIENEMLKIEVQDNGPGLERRACDELKTLGWSAEFLNREACKFGTTAILSFPLI
jgi:hypothetical protein